MERENNKGYLNIEAEVNKISNDLIRKITGKDSNSNTDNNDNTKKKLLRLIDKALGVLANDGLYAYYVFIKSQKAEEVFLDTFESLFKLVGVKYIKSNREDYFQTVSKDLFKLLFLKQILERTLIYARYHAKVLDKGE